MLKFAREATGEAPLIPGRYSTSHGLRVVDTDDGPRPVIAAGFELTSHLTKTDRMVEADDESPPQRPNPYGASGKQRMVHATLTKTASGETDFDDLSRQRDVLGRLCVGHVLTLLTKSRNRPERDDEDE